MSNKNRPYVSAAIGLSIVLVLSVVFMVVRIMQHAPQTEPALSANVVTVDDSSFESEVLASDIPVLIEFYGENCPPCQRFKPVFNDAADFYSGRVKFVIIDVDKSPGVTQLFGVQAIPTLLYLKKENEEGLYSADIEFGYQDLPDLKAFVDACLAPDAPMIELEIKKREIED